MRKLIVLSLLLFAVAAFAAEGKPVSYPSGNETINGVLYAPAGAGPFPAMVVVHEWWGLVDWPKEQAAKLADQGYVTLAVDLYRGQVAKAPEEAHEIMRGLPPERADRDLKAAVAFLKTQKNVDAKRIGAIGWCMGGQYVWHLAQQEPTLAAAVVNYGPQIPTDPAAVKPINAAVLGIFGAQDRGIPVADVQQFEKQAKQLGKKAQMVVYPDAGHGFENPNNKAGYRPADAADAWQKIVSFLQANLKPQKAGD